MRIAFLGKGGSGKSTLSGLFALYAAEKNKRVALLDVDVNSHTASMLGVTEPVIELASSESVHDIRNHLKGANPRVEVHEFLNTTPPGRESGAWTLDENNPITRAFGVVVKHGARVFTVGSYSVDRIGIDCHHGAQEIAENMLSHAQLADDDMVVIDSVAGNDTFGNTLFMQDMLIFVVKPEREGIDVFQRFLQLATEAGVGERVFAIGNQVSSDRQEAYLREHVPDSALLGVIRANQVIVDDRLDDMPLGLKHIRPADKEVFDTILAKAQTCVQPPEERHRELIAMHRKVASQSWVAGAYRKGLEDQIDEEYRP